MFGRRKDEIFLRLKAPLESFGITRYYTDDWVPRKAQSYTRLKQWRRASVSNQ